MSDALRKRLSILLEHAEHNPGALVVTRLPNNLRVDIQYTPKTTSLFISWATSEPSQADWNSVIHSWPYPLRAEPKRLQENGRTFLCAQFPTQPRLALPGSPSHTPAEPRPA